MDLLNKKCLPCEGKIKPFTKPQIKKYQPLVPGWKIAANFKKITRLFKFKDFKEAMNFVNKIALLAEKEGHHPDLHIFYNQVKIDLWTHAIKGLSENDFILAAKINKLLEKEF